MAVALYTTIRVSGDTLKEDSSGSVTEWTINHTGVTSYPTQVCHTPKDVPRLKVKNELQEKKISNTAVSQQKASYTSFTRVHSPLSDIVVTATVIQSKCVISRVVTI